MVDPALYDEYSKEKVDEAIAYLSYKKAENPRPLPKEESGKHPILYVFRHSQSEDNADFVFSGFRDPALTEKGIEQARILAEKLKDKKIDMLVTSDQKRTIETMKIAIARNPDAKKLEIIQDKRLRERCYGDLQGKSKLLMQLEDPSLLHELRRSYRTIPPNGESLEMVVKRVYEFINEIIIHMKKFKVNVAVACSGNSVRGFRKYFEHLTEEETAEIETPLAQDYAAYEVK
ncbi:MAG: Phosphoglycerate mutase [uncultured bacterium]|nr:MAG: Phosphoglycerate mutase [uncultured bacterium]